MEKSVVLITGCSSGIGRSAVSVLTQAGYDVIATARDPATLADCGASLTLALDVTSRQSIDDAMARVTEQFGGIDVLVNNAGFSVRSAVEEMDEEKAREMFDVNLWGLVRMSQAVIPAMRKRGRGKIVNIGSVVGKFTWPANGAYSASKYAVEAISDALRVELAPFGISVALIEPGAIASSFMRASIEKSADRFDDPRSPYARIYDGFRRLGNDPRRGGAPTEAVARVILAAIQADRPKPRYLAAVSPLYRAIMRMSDRRRDRFMSKVFGLKANR